MTGLRIERRGALMILTIDQEDRRNALDSATSAALDQAVDEGERDPGVAVLILTAVGPRAFCSGMDMKEAAANGPGSGLIPGRGFGGITQRRRTKPLIAAINGAAVAGGFEIALACDIVIAARSAKFIQSFANIGLIPDSGGTWVLPRLVGQARALGLAMTAEPLSAEKAEQWGLIWKCVDDEALEAESGALARKFAAGPTRGLAATKRAIRESGLQTLDQALDNERDLMRELGGSADYREGVAAFMAKRAPVFTGG